MSDNIEINLWYNHIFYTTNIIFWYKDNLLYVPFDNLTINLLLRHNYKSLSLAMGNAKFNQWQTNTSGDHCGNLCL